MEQTISDVELATFREFIRGTEIDYAEYALTYAEVRALNTTPLELVAAPGTGYVTEFLSAVLILDWNANAYVGNGILAVRETDAAGTLLSPTVALNTFLGLVANTIMVLQALSADTTIVANVPVVLGMTTGDSGTGDSPVRVKVAYRIHATGL